MERQDITIIIDRREQVMLPFAENVRTERGTLYSGDFSVKGLEHLISIERKSLNDAIGSLTSGRERFERELHRLRGFRFRRLLVVGARADIERGNYRSKASPKSILASLNAFEVRYDIPVVFASERDAAALVVRWCYWFAREVGKDAERCKRGLTPADGGATVAGK